MPLFNKQDLISELIDRTDLIVSNVQSFLRLTNDELGFKSSPNTWSIAEIFDHLNRIHGVYFKSMLPRITAAPDVEESTFSSGWLGDRVCEKIMPGPDGKAASIKVPYSLDPAGQDLDGMEVLREFLQVMDTMHDIIRHAATKNLRKIKVPYSYSGLLKLRLGDCLRYLVAYSERYVLEARQILAQVA